MVKYPRANNNADIRIMSLILGLLAPLNVFMANSIIKPKYPGISDRLNIMAKTKYMCDKINNIRGMPRPAICGGCINILWKSVMPYFGSEYS